MVLLSLTSRGRGARRCSRCGCARDATRRRVRRGRAPCRWPRGPPAPWPWPPRCPCSECRERGIPTITGGNEKGSQQFKVRTTSRASQQILTRAPPAHARVCFFSCPISKLTGGRRRTRSRSRAAVWVGAAAWAAAWARGSAASPGNTMATACRSTGTRSAAAATPRTPRMRMRTTMMKVMMKMRM